ncbi:Alanyl-tRNA editing protein Aarsd1 [Neolecta irregularis DAH-3]|uniref:Alanyl-tRNA editing protein Aarsd1 n=1 Tax=Neolecta irregularis (strain DAH-3) TaxID=1198029 RepID=A0A1U7LSX6_NEOID|nr:Alanyl-tRNA editing protein Aarsd1 [Neolecta irregularis DAH-3]|eukprot:OLL25776.1 Alanyl-tRNA editing protein Aarsd1 [Neolecta irregularis DAH-3]
MQQHSGQHLLSAVMETHFGISTLGWSLDLDTSSVEIPRKPTAEEQEMIQICCNKLIRDLVPVTVSSTKEAVSSLPKDYDVTSGLVRVITIGEIDKNPCCGTHVTNTGYLQQIVLLHLTPVRGTNFRLHFVVGDRVARLLTKSYKSLRTVSADLSCGIDDVEEKVKSSLELTRNLQRKEKYWRFIVAADEANRIRMELERRGRAYVYRAEAGLDFLTNVSIQLGQEITGLVVMFSGEGNNGGSIIVVGDPVKVKNMTTRITTILKHVKGGGKGAKWQGKVSKWEKGEIEQMKQMLEIGENNAYC